MTMIKKNIQCETLSSVKGQYKRRSKRSKNIKREARRRRKKNQRKSIAQNYKTEICRSHQMLGYCEYEDLCQFAHGVNELLPRQFGLKYKTEECKNYHTDGHCRFGSRCKFIHDEKRMKVSNNEFWLVSEKENLVRVEVVDNDLRKAELDALTTTFDKVPKTSSKDKVSSERLEDTTLWASLNTKTNEILPSYEVMSPPCCAHNHRQHIGLSSTDISPRQYCSQQDLTQPMSRKVLHADTNIERTFTHDTLPQHFFEYNNIQDACSSNSVVDSMGPQDVMKGQPLSPNQVYYSTMPTCMEDNGTTACFDHNIRTGASQFEDSQCLVTHPQINNYGTIENIGMDNRRHIDIYDGGVELDPIIHSACENNDAFLDASQVPTLYRDHNVQHYQQNYEDNQCQHYANEIAQQYANEMAQNRNLFRTNSNQNIPHERDVQYTAWYQAQALQ